MACPNYIFIGIKGCVIALDATTGAEVWVSELKGRDFVNVALLDDQLYAAAQGELFALDPATGSIRWTNKLKGWGLGLISIAAVGSGQVVLQAEQRERARAQAAGAGDSQAALRGAGYMPR